VGLPHRGTHWTSPRSLPQPRRPHLKRVRLRHQYASDGASSLQPRCNRTRRHGSTRNVTRACFA
jgi:hypothetical protein